MLLKYVSALLMRMDTVCVATVILNLFLRNMRVLTNLKNN